MVEILSIIFDVCIGMDINLGFCFTSQGLDNFVKREKEKVNKTHFPYNQEWLKWVLRKM
jgi:hypothetical protein